VPRYWSSSVMLATLTASPTRPVTAAKMASDPRPVECLN
jgi:hypothetical protein